MTNLNVSVLTSKYVISKTSPIVYVTLHDDGVWEFWSNEIIDESEIMVVSLKQIIDIDDSVTKILDLSVGFVAMRKGKDDNWEIVAKN
jgi:hypothetical protein